MPQASEAIRAYWKHGTLAESGSAALKAIADQGVLEQRGVFQVPKDKEFPDHFWKAIEYMLDEWDYDLKYI